MPSTPGPNPSGTPPPSKEDLELANEMAYYDDMAQGLHAERATTGLHSSSKVPVQALPARQYLDATVVPLLLHGLEAVATEQPQDPLEYLAAFLISNNPQRDRTLPHPPGNPLLRGLVPPPPVAAPSPGSVAPTPAP
jgi:hypothetical protein